MSVCSLPEKTLDSVVHTSAPDRPNRYLNHRWLGGLGAAGLLIAIGTSILQSRLAAQEAESAEVSAVNILAVEALTVNAVEAARAYTGEIAALRSSDLGFTRSI